MNSYSIIHPQSSTRSALIYYSQYLSRVIELFGWRPLSCDIVSQERVGSVLVIISKRNSSHNLNLYTQEKRHRANYSLFNLLVSRSFLFQCMNLLMTYFKCLGSLWNFKTFTMMQIFWGRKLFGFSKIIFSDNMLLKVSRGLPTSDIV